MLLGSGTGSGGAKKQTCPPWAACAQPVPLNSAQAACYSGHSCFGWGLGFIFTWSYYLSVAWEENKKGNSLQEHVLSLPDPQAPHSSQGLT